VTAKGVEDTSFYTYVRFAALNEVGGSPEHFGTTIEELHASSRARRARWSRAMTATSTHDTKRGEDVRARLAVLSEIPDTWNAWVQEWLEIGQRHVTTEDEEPAPTTADQYLFFQTVVGAYPMTGELGAAFEERMIAYAIKAAREAKQRTSWLSQDEAYEGALQGFISGMLADQRFVSSVKAKVDEIATHGASNGLGQVLLKIASPGIPDTYQGSETWDLRLVDPDNRGPVDYVALRRALREIEGKPVRELVEGFRDGRVKLHVVRAALQLRRARPEIFIDGDYTPVDAGEEVVAFSRHHASGTAFCAVTIRPWRVTGGRAPWAIGDTWGDRVIAVPPGRWRDALTGREHNVGNQGLAAAKLFELLPVTLLTKA
jgi:(1->4)-alpha-D-glucan 1-alpha-D-glucosylmutase